MNELPLPDRPGILMNHDILQAGLFRVYMFAGATLLWREIIIN